MTGFGSAECFVQSAAHTYRLTCEVRSSNHRYLELTLKLPPELSYLEPQLRRRIRQKVDRGVLAVTLGLELVSRTASYPQVQINEAAVSKILAELRRVQEKFAIPGTVDLNMLLSLPEVWLRQSEKLPLDKKRLRQKVLELVDTALAALNQMRQAEGQELYKEFCRRLMEILRTIHNIESYTQRVFAKSQPANNTKPEGNGTLRPITEELSRLRIHTNNFLRIIKHNKKSSVGRKLDFILTEMLREADTLIAKFRRGPVVLWGIKLKEQIDVLKEEVRNVS
ncbi:MAG: DUF1732 domain-containing protein [candidate division WOR-3 bacterium]